MTNRQIGIKRWNKHARALISHLEDEVKRLGYQELYLKTEHNRNLYEQLD